VSTQVPGEDLTSVEQSLVEYVGRGKRLDLTAHDETVDEPGMRSWGTPDSASVTADWLSVAGWVLRLLAWVFAALFIAGFTSAVRKT
jgi:hypothetical protein